LRRRYVLCSLTRQVLLRWHINWFSINNMDG